MTEMTPKPLKTLSHLLEKAAFLMLGFRPFFWLASLFSVFCIGLWGLALTGRINFQPYGGAYFWHMHEMQFGFTAAVIVGFLLTAVQNWTQVRTLHGGQLAALVVIWLIPRLGFAFTGLLPTPVLLLLDLLFLPAAALALGYAMIRARQTRNLFLVAILLVMGALNLLMHLSVLGQIPILFIDIARTQLLLISVVMCIIGGRVFPMFTANGTQTSKVQPIKAIERLSISLLVVCVFVRLLDFIPQLGIPLFVQSFLFASAGIINLYRVARWRIWVAVKAPLIWSLHLSYGAVCFGLILLGIAISSNFTTESVAHHAIAVGGIGLMVLSMMSRVSLGHTGRIIKANKAILIALWLMLMCFFLRVVFPMIFPTFTASVVLSAVLWCVAFSIFTITFLPILFGRRIDGRDG